MDLARLDSHAFTSITAYTSIYCTTFTCWCTQLPTSFYLNGKRNNQTSLKPSPKPSCHGNPWISSISLAESPGASSFHFQSPFVASNEQTEFEESVHLATLGAMRKNILQPKKINTSSKRAKTSRRVGNGTWWWFHFVFNAFRQTLCFST